MIRIVKLHEGSVARFLWLILLRRGAYVLPVETTFPQTARIIQWIADWAVRTGRAHWARELCPALRPIWNYPPRVLIYDVFGVTEEWQNAFFRFDRAERNVPDYAYAYKQVTCCYTWGKHVTLVSMKLIMAAHSPEDIRVIGLSVDDAAALEAYCGQNTRPTLNPLRFLGCFVNLGILVLNLVYALAFVLRRTRLAGNQPRDIFSAADYMNDPRDIRLYQELEDGGPILLAHRMAPPDLEKHPELGGYEICKPTDGVFTVGDALRGLAFVMAGAFRLFRHFARLHPAHFYKVAALPNRRIAYRGLFNKYRPKYFWGRDPYNVDHIVRRQELNRIGGISLGLLEATPVYTILFPHLRYVSFDRFYVLSKELYTKHYNDTWPEDMALVSTASYSITSEHLATRFTPRPNDIAVFTAIYVVEKGMVDLVRGLATAFSERKILLQVKWNFIETDDGKRFIAACTEGLSNVISVRESVYDLALKAQYVFSDPSSIIFEAMQIGAYSFAADITHDQRTNILRAYSGLCVTSAKDAVERIHDIESGRWTYPIDSCRELVDLSGRLCRDVVRADFGLPAKNSAAA